MFCPSCGSEVAEGLRFCNRCGASLGAGVEAPPRLLLLIAILSFAVLAVTVVGLLFILILGTEMMGRRDSSANTYIFMIFLFLTVLGADWLMVRQISRLLTVYLQSGGPQPTRTASSSPPGLRRGDDASSAGWSAPELTPRMPDTADLSSSPPGLRRGAEALRGGVVNDEAAAAETAILHNTNESPSDTNDQELPTRKL